MNYFKSQTYRSLFLVLRPTKISKLSTMTEEDLHKADEHSFARFEYDECGTLGAVIIGCQRTRSRLEEIESIYAQALDAEVKQWAEELVGVGGNVERMNEAACCVKDT